MSINASPLDSQSFDFFCCCYEISKIDVIVKDALQSSTVFPQTPTRSIKPIASSGHLRIELGSQRFGTSTVHAGYYSAEIIMTSNVWALN